MKFTNKNFFFAILLTATLLINTEIFAKDTTIKYSKENVSNYFLGIISVNQDHNREAFKFLKRVKSLKDTHDQFNIEFVKTLVLLEKFDEAFAFSKSVWTEDEYFFEIDLLLGLNSFINKDYKTAEKYFMRLNNLSRRDLIFENFIANTLMAWTKASQNKKDDGLKFFENIPGQYRGLIKIQSIFLKCYFDSDEVQTSYEELIADKDYDFSRYNFFLANYLLFKNNTLEAGNIIEKSRQLNNSNLLIKQTESFILNNQEKKIKNFFNCKNARDSIAELFYIVANFYASERYYSLSNFYLRISLFLNEKFLTNSALLAENYYYQKKYLLSKNIYDSLKSIGSAYSWHASKSIATILIRTKGKEKSVRSIEKDFNLLKEPNFEHYYELANFYKDNEYYEKSVKYYSLVLNNLNKEHYLIPKALDRRGTSYEKTGNWKLAEKDLNESLNILPDQAYVLNYLAYSWVDKGINLDKALAMLNKAMDLKKNDPYITDSIGWAYFAKKKYDEAEFFLQKALELLPTDPIINDHYADTLWMLNKNIQARHVWNQVLRLNEAEQKLKDAVKEKLIFGIKKKL